MRCRWRLSGHIITSIPILFIIIWLFSWMKDYPRMIDDSLSANEGILHELELDQFYDDDANRTLKLKRDIVISSSSSSSNSSNSSSKTNAYYMERELLLWPLPTGHVHVSGYPLPLAPNIDIRASTEVVDVLMDAMKRCKDMLMVEISSMPWKSEGRFFLEEVLIDVAVPMKEKLWPSTLYNYTMLLEKGSSRLRISSYTPFGAIYALETLTSMTGYGHLNHSVINIVDAPMYSYRGLMLDVGRRFFPVPLVRQLIDGMLMAKLNVLHLHLSDFCRFAVESKTFPELTRNLTGLMEGHYTHEDIDEIVEYAHGRGIRVVPEIDIPGHSQSLFPLRKYGAQFCISSDGLPLKLSKSAQLFNDDSGTTLEILKNLVKEMVGLFPDPVFHIGCDEVAFHGLCTLNRATTLQLSLMNYIRKRGKIPMAWEEVATVTNSASKDVIVSSRNKVKAPRVAIAGIKVIEASSEHFDLGDPNKLHYHFWTDIAAGAPKDEPGVAARIQGGETTMWTDEYCNTMQCGGFGYGGRPIAHALFNRDNDDIFAQSVLGMIFPRALIAAGSFWNYVKNVSAHEAALLKPVAALQRRMMKRGIDVCPPGCHCTETTQCGLPYLF